MKIQLILALTYSAARNHLREQGYSSGGATGIYKHSDGQEARIISSWHSIIGLKRGSCELVSLPGVWGREDFDLIYEHAKARGFV